MWNIILRLFTCFAENTKEYVVILAFKMQLELCGEREQTDLRREKSVIAMPS